MKYHRQHRLQLLISNTYFTAHKARKWSGRCGRHKKDICYDLNDITMGYKYRLSVEQLFAFRRNKALIVAMIVKSHLSIVLALCSDLWCFRKADTCGRRTSYHFKVLLYDRRVFHSLNHFYLLLYYVTCDGMKQVFQPSELLPVTFNTIKSYLHKWRYVICRNLNTILVGISDNVTSMNTVTRWSYFSCS